VIRRILTVCALGVTAAVVACVDMSAPSGPASISVLQLPALFVVRGDVMRDSLGNPAAPQVIAYDADGNPVGAADAQFFVTDSNAAARFDNGVLAGRRLGIAHVLGQIGGLQTASVPVNVTVAPTKFAAQRPADTLRASFGLDSALSLGSVVLGTTVRGAGDTAVAGVFVSYRLARTLASAKAAQPAVFLTDDAGNLSTLDTTDVGGNASRKLVVVSHFLADSALIAGQRIDSVVVEAHTMYRGSELGGPIRFAVPVKVGFPAP
jgi:hypothetical protein